MAGFLGYDNLDDNLMNGALDATGSQYRMGGTTMPAQQSMMSQPTTATAPASAPAEAPPVQLPAQSAAPVAQAHDGEVAGSGMGSQIQSEAPKEEKKKGLDIGSLISTIMAFI